MSFERGAGTTRYLYTELPLRVYPVAKDRIQGPIAWVLKERVNGNIKVTCDGQEECNKHGIIFVGLKSNFQVLVKCTGSVSLVSCRINELRFFNNKGTLVMSEDTAVDSVFGATKSVISDANWDTYQQFLEEEQSKPAEGKGREKETLV